MIRVPTVRLIDEEGTQVGIVPTDEARDRATDAGLDLVEVSPNAEPPVCKIIDYGKLKYEKQKKKNEAARNRRSSRSRKSRCGRTSTRTTTT